MNEKLKIVLEVDKRSLELCLEDVAVFVQPPEIDKDDIFYLTYMIDIKYIGDIVDRLERLIRIMESGAVVGGSTAW